MMDEPAAEPPFERLRRIVAQLRAPGGCPWDREQTHESLVPGLLEETYEVAEAIRTNDEANLREELGDLLLQVVLHAQIAAGSGALQRGRSGARVSVINSLGGIRTFSARARRDDTGAVLKQWDEIKRAEKGASDQSYFSGLTKALPALMLAQKVQTKAALVNFDWSELQEVVAKVDEELAEAKEAIAAQDASAMADELGDLLFAVVNLIRKQKLDAETVLAAATEKFIKRFHAHGGRVKGDR